MKKTVLITLILNLFFFLTIYSQEQRKINNNVFKRGEFLKFEAYYYSLLTGRVTAGIATLEITNENTKINDRNTLHVEGIGKTKGVFHTFYKVVDRYETYIDEETIVPLKFVRRVNEAGFKIEQDVYFNQLNKTAIVYQIKNTNSKPYSKTISLPEYTQDIISAFYYARTLDLTDIKINQEFPIKFILDDSVYVTKIIYEGKQNIKTRLGEFRCMKFKPMVLKGNVFSEPYPMTLYITDDDNRIPILAESAVLIGSVKLELIKYSGLVNPVTSKIK